MVTGTNVYMVERAEFYGGLVDGPGNVADDDIRGNEHVSNLRGKLRRGASKLVAPVRITISGTLFPCALLSSGWWERQKTKALANTEWRDDIQRWLFQGFDEWGPSWDFSWDFDNWETSKDRPYYIAQLGDGDEANSLPVLIPGPSARAVQRFIDETGGWGGFQADITGILGHRRHFEKHLTAGALKLLGGLLDYCLWIDPDDPDQGIEPRANRTGMYSGYLWRCVAPKALVGDRFPKLNEVYFVWEHTNFASRDAVAYNLDSLDRKEAYLRRRYGDLILVQKSSSLVPGVPAWTQQEIYKVLLGKSNLKF